LSFRALAQEISSRALFAADCIFSVGFLNKLYGIGVQDDRIKPEHITLLKVAGFLFNTWSE
jgi:hypothetical protein